jgi:two-component system LytT family sensor kinase
MSMRGMNAKRIVKTWSIILGISLLAHSIRWLSGQFSPGLNSVLSVTQFIGLVLSWEFLRSTNTILNRKLPYERNIPARMLLQLAIGIVYALFLRLLIYLFAEPLFPFKLDSLFLAATWFLYALMSVGINAIFFIQFFISKWKSSIVETERLEKEKAQVQFDNLKNQLNPHFLFNSLSSLNSLITEDQQLASKFLQHMSKVYRYVLQNKDRNTVTLETELQFIRNYIFLLETRFGKAISVTLNIDKVKEERLMVPVTLQTLVENAIKHNIADGSRPLRIDIFTSGDYLVVSNNLQKRTAVDTSNKQGLDNLKSLYGFLTPEPVIVEETEDRFYVKVPLL